MGELEPVLSEMEGETDLLLPSELLLDLFVFTFEILVGPFLMYLCLYFRHSTSSSFFLGRATIFIPGPCLASTTCAQFLFSEAGSLFHLLTMRTQALQMSPLLSSSIWKQPEKLGEYRSLAVKRELKMGKNQKKSEIFDLNRPARLRSAYATAILGFEHFWLESSHPDTFQWNF